MIYPCCISAQGKAERIKFNYGAKAGFQAIAYNNPVFDIEGYELESDNLHSNKIGYTIAPFLRLTKKRFYIQAESILGISRHSFSFKSADGDVSLIPNQATYSLKTFCLQLPIVFGYSIINEGKYVMSLFSGPKTKFVFTSHDSQEFKHFEHLDLEEILRKKCYYWEFGLGVRIGYVFFDFTYDLGITKVSEYIVSRNDGKRYKSQRKENIFSFSIGVMF